MGVPSGKIVARPMVARACGCVCEFQHYAVDKYRAQRLAKFRQTRCPACVAKLEEERRRAVAARPTKSDALAALPAGSYTVTENANAGKTIGSNSSAFFNTDPGPTPKTSALTHWHRCEVATAWNRERQARWSLISRRLDPSGSAKSLPRPPSQAADLRDK